MVSGISFPGLMAWLTAYVTRGDEAEAWRISDAWFQASLRHAIIPAARARVDWHRAQGHHVAIVSAATPLAVRPVAQSLGLGEAYLATRLELASGSLTGRIAEPACYRAGKVLLTRAYAERHGLELRRSFFYTDSHHDLPLLEQVGHPVAINPSLRLARIAKARGWTIERFY